MSGRRDAWAPDAYTARQRALVERIRREISPPPLAGRTTQVPDFEGDAGRCLTSLVEVPGELAERIAREAIAPLRAADPDVYAYRTAQLHATLKNVRTVKSPPDFGPAEVAAARRVHAEIVPRMDAFEIRLEDCLMLSGSVVLVGYTDARLHGLLAALDAGLREAGVPDDKRYFSREVFVGLVTIARFAGPPAPALARAADALRGRAFGAFRARDVLLVASNAVYAPASRTRFGSYRLREGEDLPPP